MARRRKAKPEIDKKLIIEAFAEMASDKSIDKDLLQGVLEETLSMIVRKKYGMEADFDIIVNMDKGDIEIYMMRDIVEEVEDPETEISLKDAKMYGDPEEEYEVGDEFIEEITLDNIADNFGRRLISLASQNLNQRIREIEKDNIYNEYINKVGDIIVGEVHQVRRHDVLVMHNKIETRLPREEQIPNEPYRFKKNQTMKCIVKEVRRNNQGSHPDIILSRGSEQFLAKLFEIEIPEIYDGIIQIKSIARDPGERSKVAVLSYDDRVDPVGACVGMKGIRIHSIVRELNNENIDLIQYTEDPYEFIRKSLAPAKVKDVEIDEATRTANVIVPEDQVSLAIGKNGQNVRLSSKLTGYSITLVKEGSEDIDLSEFVAELGKDLLEELEFMEVTTAREFLDTAPEKLIMVPGMTKELLSEMRDIILVEFDEQEEEGMAERVERAARLAAEVLKEGTAGTPNADAEQNIDKAEEPAEVAEDNSAEVTEEQNKPE
ncbi:MAG: transcription termination factor NusA [Candidatus Kapaibacteriales bacterium]